MVLRRGERFGVELSALQRQKVQAGQSATTVVKDAEGTPKIRMWDKIDRAWTPPVDMTMATSDYLRRGVLKCSACRFTSSYDGDVGKHIRKVLEEYGTHKNARLNSTSTDHPRLGIVTLQTCTGCNAVFQVRKGAGKQHLEEKQSASGYHVDAYEVQMTRFALEPTEPVVVNPSSNGRGHKGAESASVDWTLVKRSRGRKRKRNRRANGSS